MPSTSAPDISAFDRVTYLFGDPIIHSLSPLLHQVVYKHLSLNWSYLLYESRDIPAFLQLIRDPKCIGSAVTMPHKVAIIPHLDDLTPEGRAIGAINTIFFKTSPTGDRLLIGTNTDCIGIREAIRQNVSELQFKSFKSKPALVVGGGGTSRSAIYSLTQFLGCTPIYIINRDASEVQAVIKDCTTPAFKSGLKTDFELIHVTSIEQASSLSTPAVIVSAIPDFVPQTESEKLVRDMMTIMLEKGRGKGTILEMCYHPSPDTQIARLAASNEWQVVPGTEAMIWQGLEQDRFWTGQSVSEMPAQDVKDVISKAVAGSH
ncbi:hypothetical protein F5884DRAFT_342845 [Xylogone sp. PMI_703]|nr:hypothetical protein F5884DRAFT_342845 [Xylogone sp. PMI_703]